MVDKRLRITVPGALGSFTFSEAVSEDRPYRRALACAILAELGCDFQVALLPEDVKAERTEREKAKQEAIDWAYDRSAWKRAVLDGLTWALNLRVPDPDGVEFFRAWYDTLAEEELR